MLSHLMLVLLVALFGGGGTVLANPIPMVVELNRSAAYDTKLLLKNALDTEKFCQDQVGSYDMVLQFGHFLMLSRKPVDGAERVFRSYSMDNGLVLNMDIPQSIIFGTNDPLVFYTVKDDFIMATFLAKKPHPQSALCTNIGAEFFYTLFFQHDKQTNLMVLVNGLTKESEQELLRHRHQAFVDNNQALSAGHDLQCDSLPRQVPRTRKHEKPISSAFKVEGKSFVQYKPGTVVEYATGKEISIGELLNCYENSSVFSSELYVYKQPDITRVMANSYGSQLFINFGEVINNGTFNFTGTMLNFGHLHNMPDGQININNFTEVRDRIVKLQPDRFYERIGKVTVVLMAALSGLLIGQAFGYLMRMLHDFLVQRHFLGKLNKKKLAAAKALTKAKASKTPVYKEIIV